MTPEQREQLTAYFAEVAAAMRFNAWDFWVSPEVLTEEESTILNITVDERRHWAKVRVGTFFKHDPDSPLSYTREEQRQAVVHEILHTSHGHLTWWFEHGPWLQFDFTRVDRQLLELEVLGALEVVIDLTARLIAPSMPMPPEWHKWPGPEDHDPTIAGAPVTDGPS